MPDLEYISPRTNRKYVIESIDPTYTPTDDDYRQAALKVEQLETGTEQSALGAMASSAAQGLTSIPGTVAQGVGALTGITGLEESGKYFADQARALTPIDPMRREDFSTKAAGAVGQAVGQLGVALATGGGSIGILGMAGAMGAASGAESAEARGLTGVRRYGEILGYGATEIVSERLFGLGSKSFFKPATDFQAKVLKTGKTIGGEAVEEAAAGLGTNIVSNLTAFGTDIPTPDILSGEAFKGYVEQALLGAVGGTVFAGAQLAMKTQATEQSVTKKTAMVDGEERDVTGVSDEDLVFRGVDPTTIKVQTVFTQADAQAVDQAPTPGSKKIVEEIFANGVEVPLEAPTQEQLDTFDSAIAQAAAEKAAAAQPAAAQPAEQKALEDAAYAEANTWDLANKVSRSDEWFEGGNADPDAIQGYQDSEAAGGMQLQAHGMSKEATLSGGVRNLLGLLRNGLDINRRGGRLDTAPVVSSDPNASGGATASGTAYKDGPFTLIARPGQGLSGDLSGLGAVVINQANAAQAEAIKKAIQAVRPDVLVGTVSELGDITRNLLSTPAVKPTPTPTPDATQIGQIPESNLGQYPDGNEVGTATETGDRNRPVESGQVEQAVAQVPTVEQPLPSEISAAPTPAIQRDLERMEQMTPEERKKVPVKGDTAAFGIFSTRKEAQAKLESLSEGIVKSPQMTKILEEYGLVPTDIYSVVKTRNKWTLGRTPKHEIAVAAQRNLPVSVSAVDAYGVKLPKGYVQQGELYVFNPEATATQTLPSGAVPTGSLPTTPMTDVSGGVAPVKTTDLTTGPKAARNVDTAAFVAKQKAKGIPPTASLTPDGNIVFPTPEAAPGVPQQARRTPLNSAVVKQTVQKVFGIVPKNIEFIDTDERVDGKAFVKDQRVQINLRYIQSKERLEKVLREEAFHLIYQDPLVQADVELLKQEIPDDIKAEIDQLYSDPRFTDSVRLEESVARLVERLSEKTAWQRFVGSVRAAFQKLFGRAPSPRELTLAANRILERAVANVAVQQTAEGAQGTEDAGDVRMSVTPESQRIDQEYLAAVEAGDMETAQRIVDEAAKKAGYTERMFHGTSSQPGDINSSITRFAPPSWWTRDKAQAQRFANATVEGWTPKVYEAYLKVGQSMELSSPQAAEDFIRAPWMQEIIKSGKTPEGTPDTFTVKGRDWLIPLRADQVKSADPVTRDDAGNIIPPSKRFQKTSDDIRYSVTPTVQIFGEKVVATAIEVQSRRELMAAVKDKVFDYTQPESAEGDREWRDIMDRWRPTESGPPDLSNFKEIITEDAAPGAVTAALYIYANKKQDGGLALQELRDSIEFSKYFPKEGWIDFWTEAGIGGNVREAGRGLGILAYAVGGLNKAQNVSSNADVQTEAAAKGLDLPESDMRAIDISVNAVPEEGAISGNLDKVTSTGGNSVIDTLTKLLSPSGSTDPTNNPDNSPATDPKSIEQISAQKLVKDATKKDKKPKDTTQTDAVTAIVQDHLEKKGGQLEADLTRKLTEAGMSPEAAKKLATNTEKKLERDAKKESEREAKALEGAKELSDADRSAKRIVKNLSVTQSDTWDWPIKKSIDPIVALIARYYKANGQMSEEQLENALLALGVSGPLGRVLTNAATAELGKRAAVKAARDRARRDNAATKSAENFTKNWQKSQDPAQQTEKKAPDEVRAFLNEQSKVLRNQIHFDLSPNGKALFFDTVYTRLINFNVSPEAAMAATSAAYQKYLTNRANKIAKLRDTVAKEGLSKALAKQILNLTRTQQRDPEFAKQFIEQTLIDAGVPQDIANASVPLLLPSFQKALADAREKALMDFINGRPPSAKRIPKEKLDDLRKAVRLGATNPDYQPSTPFAKANGWQNFTRAEHDEMARQDEIASDPLQTNQERQLALSKIAKIASKRMPKNNKLSLFAEIYRNSALSNFLSTGGIQVYTPMFAAAVRTFTDGVRGLTQERNLNRFIASLEGFLRAASVPALKAELISSFGQNITTYNKAYEIDDLSQLHKLLLDGIETWKTTKSPLKKAKSLISITYGSMDYVRRSYAALDNVSQSVFYRQIMDLGMRDIILSKGGSETEFKNLISNRTRYHEQLVTELISQGQSPSRAWVNASELSYRQMNGDLVDIYGDDVAVEIQAKDEMSRKEAARELGVAPDEELDGHVIPVLIDTIKGLSKAADKRFAESGKLTTLILFGFPITALKVMNRSLDYSPIGILRGAMSERESKQFANDPEYKSKYPSYKTDTQKQQRMAEAAVGTAAMIMFLMMVLNEREKEPEDRLFMVHNAGPRDRAARQIWRAAGNEPQSVQFRFSKDSPWLGISWAKAGLEVFTPVFATAGATFDSMDPTIRREDAYDQIMVFFSQTLASMSRPLSSIQDTAGVVSGKEMSLSGRSLANQVGFRASSFLPWSSMARNYNKWQGARDTSNAGSAFAAMIPIVGPSLTEPALNSLGDPVGKTPNEYSYKIGTAIPVSVGFRREDTPLYEFLLNKGKFPTTISRPTQEKKYGQMTNETWRKFVEIRGQTLKSLILQRKESLDKMDSEKYDDMIENLTRIANDRARNQLKLRPAKK